MSRSEMKRQNIQRGLPMNLSLDDQLKLAQVYDPDEQWVVLDNYNEDVEGNIEHLILGFNPTSPDTLMRLMFNLKIDVEWVELDEVGRGAMQCQVYRRLTLKRFLKHCRTPEEIADAILECAMAVING